MQKMKQEAANGTIIIPYWKSAPYWPLIYTNNLVDSANRQPRQPKTKKDHATTESFIELCTKYKDSNDLTVVRDLSMITLFFFWFFTFDEISSIRCKYINFMRDLSMYLISIGDRKITPINVALYLTYLLDDG
jgi:hypothetical protein